MEKKGSNQKDVYFGPIHGEVKGKVTLNLLENAARIRGKPKKKTPPLDQNVSTMSSYLNFSASSPPPKNRPVGCPANAPTIYVWGIRFSQIAIDAVIADYPIVGSHNKDEKNMTNTTTALWTACVKSFPSWYGYCQEALLHAQMKQHICRVKHIEDADVVWAETYFMTHVIADGAEGYRQHLFTWLEELQHSTHYLHHNHHKYFFYMPRNAALGDANAMMKRMFDSQSNFKALYAHLHIVSHNVGYPLAHVHPEVKKCITEMGSHAETEQCLTGIMNSGNVNQTLQLNVIDDPRPKQRHIAIPFLEPHKSLREAPSPGSVSRRTQLLLIIGDVHNNNHNIALRKVVEGTVRHGDVAIDATEVLNSAGLPSWKKGSSSSSSSYRTKRNVDEETVLRAMRSSIFCLDVQGESLTTRRLTQFILSGCIPVLICDDCIYPFGEALSRNDRQKVRRAHVEEFESKGISAPTLRFPSMLSYNDFAVVIRDKDAASTYRRLSQLSQNTAAVRALQHQLNVVRWYFEPPGLTASSMLVEGLMEEMSLRVKQQQTSEEEDAVVA
eukprot:PhM_4_TR8180/c0_g1_i1/m.29224